MKKLLIALLAACALIMPANAFNHSTSYKPTLQLAAYASGQSLGGMQTATAFIQNSQSSGILYGVWLGNAAGATTAVTVYIFDQLPTATTCTDRASFVLGAADVAKLAITPFVLTPAVPVGTTASFAQTLMIASLRNKDAPRTANLYICLLANGAVTPASTTDYTLKLLGDL